MPTLATLSRLTEPNGPYDSTVVFATATQPAFDALDERLCSELGAVGWQPDEIARAPRVSMQRQLGALHVTWRHESAIDLDDLASELAQHERVLCIVNLKRHAVRLATAITRAKGPGPIAPLDKHVPRAPGDRAETIGQRLSGGLPVRLVATQCVEAGVDLDFPLVYRALAPLEAIAQAAGRCNRHGRREPGRVVVFKPRDDRGLYPPGYGEAVDSTETFLANLAQHGDLDDIEILNNPKRLRDYFRHFYSLSGRVASGRDNGACCWRRLGREIFSRSRGSTSSSSRMRSTCWCRMIAPSSNNSAPTSQSPRALIPN